jgi:hypothetical protein
MADLAVVDFAVVDFAAVDLAAVDLAAVDDFAAGGLANVDLAGMDLGVLSFVDFLAPVALVVGVAVDWPGANPAKAANRATATEIASARKNPV